MPPDIVGVDSLLRRTTERAVSYLGSLDRRPVAPPDSAISKLGQLSTALPDLPTPAEEVIEMLDTLGSPATVASNGGRYFGFVIGSSLPAALAANWLAGAWNQNSCMEVMSPVAAQLESVALGWIRELLGLPPSARGAFVTGDTMAIFSGVAAARHAVLEKAGWDVGSQGLFGAPAITVIVGEEVHVTVLKALSLLGLGRDRVVRVPTDGQGRMNAEKLGEIAGPTIVCIQAGNVNTGAFDPAREICERAHAAGAWVHVDGAFGLWAHAAPARRHLAAGMADADSWAVDGHKWLNVPYDSGMVFVREGRHLRAAMSGAGGVPYLTMSEKGEHTQFAPELSRRARGVDAWAALRSLGRSGVADLIERCCRHAARLAELLRAGGCTILNDVVLNQVLVSFGSDEETLKVIVAVQKDGTCWCGGTVWHGRTAMRISVSSWATTEDDIRRSAAAILRAAAQK